MASEQAKRAFTAPKGRPTPTRAGVYRRRTFGPVLQWLAVGLLGVVLFVIVLLLLDGGDFNPFGIVLAGLAA